MNIRDRLAHLERKDLSATRANMADMSDEELLKIVQRATTVDLNNLADVELDALLLTISKGGSHVTA